MNEPEWLNVQIVCAIQAEQIAVYGGAAGVRDAGLLASALDRRRNQWAYGETGLHALAAAYAFGIAKNHPFVDGNKRTAFVAVELFLALNGWNLVASDADAVLTMLAVAAGTIDEAEFAEWIRRQAKH